MFLFNPNNLLFIWTYVNDCFNVFFFFYSFASALTYYGICFSVGSFGVNIYLAQFFSGLSEAPSLLLPFLLKRWGRRPFCMGSLFLSGISCMLSLLVSKFCGERHRHWNTIHEHRLIMVWYCLVLTMFIWRISLLMICGHLSFWTDIPALVMTLALMGKLCMQSTYCVSVLYGIELFPTVIRYTISKQTYLIKNILGQIIW